MIFGVLKIFIYQFLLTNDPDTGRLVFTLNDKHHEIYTSVELKFALEEGYKITKFYGFDSYLKRRGLLKEYVEFFYKMKIENTRFYTPEECAEINKGF